MLGLRLDSETQVPLTTSIDCTEGRNGDFVGV